MSVQIGDKLTEAVNLATLVSVQGQLNPNCNSYSFVAQNSTLSSLLDTSASGLVLLKSITDDKWLGTHSATYSIMMTNTGNTTEPVISKQLNYTLSIEVKPANQTNKFNATESFKEAPVSVDPIAPTYRA